MNEINQTAEQNDKIVSFTFGDSEPLGDAKDLLTYLQCTELDKWYEPPINFNTLANTFSSSSYHSSPIYVKRNILTSTFIPHKYLSRSAFERIANDFLILGNGYLEKRNNLLKQPDGLKPALAKYTRRGVDTDQYFYLDQYLDDHEFKKGSIWHLLMPEINQEIYGVPEYLSALNSVWLDNSATVFRQRYYKNGSHAGFILYLSNPSHNEKDIEELKKALQNSKGPGNFRNLLMYAPNGKPDGLKLIPVGEVAAKDNFADIKSVSQDDILTAHRVPPSLMGITPKNTGGFGDPEKASIVFARNEIKPLQDRFLQLNDWMGEEIVRFTPYKLE
ncbi:phage portal protein [Utexia brackfieldae]|uniref:phage portal protein n=1 Tax=Utexia brackfieldae TaxID=3074108 RepID=UPI00370D6BF5